MSSADDDYLFAAYLFVLETFHDGNEKKQLQKQNLFLKSTK